jgi:DNA-binding NarL/FixJ family response regulator
MQKSVRLTTIYRHRLFQDCLHSVLSRERRYCVSGVDHTADDALEQIRRAAPDVVIVDTGLPDHRGMELTRKVRRQLPQVKVLAIASAQARGELIACIEAGAHGCILEETSIDDLKAAIETVLRGEPYCTRQATDLLFAQLAAAAEEARVRRRIEPGTLTQRELEVLEMVAEGYSNKQIAQELHLSLYTVKNHVHNILEKLPVSSRHEAAHLAREERWLPE